MSKKLTLGFLVVLTSTVYAASFDCGKATTNVEKIICADSSLQYVDDDLNGAFQTIYSTLDENERKIFRGEQLAWLRNRNSCGDQRCVLDSYLSRLEELKKRINIPEWTKITYQNEQLDVMYQYATNKRVDSFNSHGAKLPGKVTQCKILVDVPVGSAGGNNSYGGLCVLEMTSGNRYVKICDDEMVGHFAFEVIPTYSITTEELGQFVARNCFGG